MKIGPLGTVCYRLLVEPELGTGLGNTVFVGLELRDADHAELMFSGLERRIETIRGELDRVRTYTVTCSASTGQQMPATWHPPWRPCADMRPSSSSGRSS